MPAAIPELIHGGSNSRIAGESNERHYEKIRTLPGGGLAVAGRRTDFRTDGTHQTACAATMPMSSLSGMVPMYLLMSGFHLTPWVKLLGRWRNYPRAA
jgi:hypothetical protein